MRPLVIAALTLIAGCQVETYQQTTVVPNTDAAQSSDAAQLAPATNQHLSVTIDGMTCSGCVSKIYSSLKAQPGIGAVMIDLESAKGEIEYDDQQIDQQRILTAIEALNYKANLVQ